MDKVVIGLTCSEYREDERYMQAVNEDYISAIIRAGGVPVLLPICEEDVMKEQVENIDGLLVTGGIDVNPLFYHERYHMKQDESSYRRDLYEIELIRYAAQRHKPILGICRGQQVINVAFGGTLYQDNTLASEYVMQHQQKEKRAYPSHTIRIKKESLLSPIFGDVAYVNSFHHQSVKKLAEGFKITARSEDSIVEAIEHTNLPIWAVQFHPEGMCCRDEKMQEIFNEFIKRVKESV